MQLAKISRDKFRKFLAKDRQVKNCGCPLEAFLNEGRSTYAAHAQVGTASVYDDKYGNTVREALPEWAKRFVHAFDEHVIPGWASHIGWTTAQARRALNWDRRHHA